MSSVPENRRILDTNVLATVGREQADVVPGRSGTMTAASPDGTTTVEIDGRHIGIGAFASQRILVTV